MKINLPFHSITKVITNTCLLILIVSAIHIITIFSSFNSHISETDCINKLSELQISTIKLNYAARYQPEEMLNIVTGIEQILSPAELLKSSWFKTQSLNQKSTAILTHWQEIKLQITEQKLEQIEVQLNNFSLSVDHIIKEHQMLAGKKIALVHFTELIELLLILFAALFLFYYSKRQIILPVEKLIANVKSLKEHHFAVDFPNNKNEIGILSQSMADMSKETQILIEDIQNQIEQKTQALEKANQTIEFLYSISQQLSSVKLTSPILTDALNSLAKQANLHKVCIELNNGTFVNGASGCASLDPNLLRVPIIINTKPYGFLNYVMNENAPDQRSLIESFTGLVARALYQEEYSLQTQKILLMEERGIIARELHDSIAQSLSFLKTQCSLLDQQVSDSQQTQAMKTINLIETAVADADIQLHSLLSTFKLSASGSSFKEAMLTMISELQKQTPALISIKQFTAHFYTDASQHINLLQIVREAIINAIKYAQCTTISVSCIINEDDNVCIYIIDNGVATGNKTDKLAKMKQRADNLNAILSVTPLAQGTEVKLIFPYKKSWFNQEIAD